MTPPAHQEPSDVMTSNPAEPSKGSWGSLGRRGIMVLVQIREEEEARR